MQNLRRTMQNYAGKQKNRKKQKKTNNLHNYAELMQNYAEADLCRTMRTRAALIQSVTLSAVVTFDHERALTELIQSALAPCHQSALGTGVIVFSGDVKRLHIFAIDSFVL